MTTVAFLAQLGLRETLPAFVDAYGFVPSRVHQSLAAGLTPGLEAAAVAGLSSMFLHGGWFHIIGNMLYLRVFGDNVEDRFGHVGFLALYLCAGLAGAAGQYAFDPSSPVPMIGASGAVAGTLGAYLVLFPRAKVLTLFPVFVVFTFIEVPAMVFLGIWGLQQFLNGYLQVADVLGSGGGVAWFAHIGGFACGIVAGAVVRAVGRRRGST